MAKKKLKTEEDLAGVSLLLNRLKKSGTDIETAKSTMDAWRYIDFHNQDLNSPSLALEWLFGGRGLLAGRILQLRARFSKGKSSLMYMIYASAQKLLNAFCMHIETEGASAPADYIASFGADPSNLLVAELSSLEDCLATVDEVICEIRGGFGGTAGADGRIRKTKFTDPIDPEMKNPIVIGIDSLSSLGQESGVNIDIADVSSTSALSYHSRKLREYLRDRVARFRSTHTLLMLASHETAKIETGYGKRSGDGKSSLAGEAIGIHGTYGVDLDSKPYYDEKLGGEIGSRITLRTFKNKLSPPHRELTLYLVWNSGFDLTYTDAEFLIKHVSSPFVSNKDKYGDLRRHAHGVTCDALMDKDRRESLGLDCDNIPERSYPNDAEFIKALYNDEALTMMLREDMRIRGFGFDFETKFKIEDDDELEEQEEEARS